jgi:hypothetical protein
MNQENLIEIPKPSDHMTIKQWIRCVKSGGFIDYDGYGYYATKTKMSNKIVRPSDVKNKKIDKTFSYIVWFNR